MPSQARARRTTTLGALISLIALAVLGSIWAAPQASAREASVEVASAAEDGSLGGSVRAFGSDAPVAGVLVEAFADDDTTTPTASTTTDGAGDFVFTDLPAGNFALRYTDGNAGGFAPQWLRADGVGTVRDGAQVIAAGGSSPAVTAPTMTLVDTDVSHVDLGVAFNLPVMRPTEDAAVIIDLRQGRWRVDGIGNVVATDGELVVTSNANLTIITAVSFGEEAGSCRVETPQRAVCDNPGYEVYLGVRLEAAGPVSVTATYSSSSTEATPDGLPNTVTRSTVVEVLPARFGFVVHDDRHRPVVNASVWAYLDEDTWVPSSPQAYETTDALGNVLFEDLPAGSYRFLVVPVPPSDVPAQWLGGDTRARAWSMDLMPGFDVVTTLDLMPHLVIPRTISGVVTADGAPAAGVTVRAFAAGSVWAPAATTTTAADGSYSFTGLAPSRYSLRFDPPSGSDLGVVWLGGTAGRGASTVVDTLSTSIPRTGIDQELPLRGAVTGTITGPSGPVAGVRIVFFAPGDTFGGSHEVTTGPDGTYATPALPAGTYLVRIVPPAASGLAVEWFDDTADRAQATSIVAGPTLVDVSAELAP